jgi:hypothetical protein
MSYEGLGAQVYAASELGTQIQPWWNVRTITPSGEGPEVGPYPRRFARPVTGGSARPFATLFGRQIGPSGAEGPIEALGNGQDAASIIPLPVKVLAGAAAAYIAYLLIAKPIKENPGRKFMGISPRGERLMGEVNPEDMRYIHIFAVKAGKERYVGQVLDTGGAYFSVYKSGKQEIARTAKQAAEALVANPSDTDDYRTQVLHRQTPWGMMRHLVIERHDGKPVRGWNTIQAIKDESLGDETWAVEVYPPTMDIVDEVNRRHLWEVPEHVVAPLNLMR